MKAPPGDTISSGSSPRRIRQNNVVAALQCLYAHGRLSRADLARKLGLNRSSSGDIVAGLTASGLVREIVGLAQARGEQARAGRPGIMLELVPDAAFFIGVEIGVEHMTSVEIDLAANVRTHRSLPFESRTASVEEAIAAARNLAFGQLDDHAIERCRGIGLSLPAHITTNGYVTLAPLIGWRDVDLAAVARQAMPSHLPIIIENDANALAIGEGYRSGRVGVTLFLQMETGIGGGILIDGKLFRGGHGLAGEIGHTLVPGSGGKELEQLIGRERLLHQYRQATGRSDLDFQGFLLDVRDRVPAAVAIAEDWSRHFASALSQACRLIDPDRVVLGGSVAQLYPMVAARVASHMTEGQSIAFPLPEIVVGEGAELGSAYGAACLLHQRFLSIENEDLAVEDGAVGKSRASARA